MSDEGKSEPGEPKRPAPQSGVDKVRAERRRQLESEPGYKAGKALGKQFRSSILIVLPIEMALGPVLVTLVGWWLDRRYDTSPIFVLVGIALGLTLAIRAIRRAIKEVSR